MRSRKALFMKALERPFREMKEAKKLAFDQYLRDMEGANIAFSVAQDESSRVQKAKERAAEARYDSMRSRLYRKHQVGDEGA